MTRNQRIARLITRFPSAWKHRGFLIRDEGGVVMRDPTARCGNKPARKARRSKLNYEPHSTPFQQWLRKLRADTRSGGGGFGHSGTTIAKGPGNVIPRMMSIGGLGI